MAAVYDIRLTEGYDYLETFTFNDSNGDPKDLSNNTYDCDIVATIGGAVIDSFTVSTAQASSGILTLSMSDTDITTNFDAGTRYYYDLMEINPGSQRTQLMIGRIEVAVGISDGA